MNPGRETRESKCRKKNESTEGRSEFYRSTRQQHLIGYISRQRESKHRGCV